MRILYGKGVWAWEEDEVGRAIDMAQAIGARIVLFKTGQEGEYLGPAARRVVKRVYGAGLIPCAWPVVTCREPEAEADVAIQSVLDGYAGLVFDFEKPASRQYEGAQRLGEIMIETEMPPEAMFFTSLPNISANPDLPYAQMSRFCRGGFMPQAYASFGWSPGYTLDVITYREFQVWSAAQAIQRPLYPILGLYRDPYGRQPLTIGEMRGWFDALSRYKPPFFSVYRAGVVPEVIWPLMAEIETTPAGQAPPPLPPVKGEYVTVAPGDTMSQICTQHGCSRQDFWMWNGHLWDARNKKRDPNYLERGWIVRVQ